VLGLIALPYIVLPMYLVFGRRKLMRRSLRRATGHAGTGHWAQDLIESFGLSAASPASINMHEDGHESAAALFTAMSESNRRLDICTYILADDDFGRECMRRMMECARRGVEVRLLLDGVGALQLPGSCFKQMRAAGIKTAIFSPLLARRTQGPRNLRNHRKMVVADGFMLWAGGRNLAAEYFFGKAGTPAWRDLTFDLRGAAADAAAAQFEADWIAACGKPAEHEVAARLSDSSRDQAQFLPSGPDQAEDTVHALLIDACFHARSRILAVTPYFVPDVALETAMRLAARRGVQIDLVIPATSNHRLADFARSRALRSLSSAGANVHLLSYMNHAKAVVFDDSLALSGSPNLDSRSLLLNYECAVVFYGRGEIEWLAKWITALRVDSRPFDCTPPGLLRDLAEGLLLSIAYQL
jgi:cardiolipin synthase